MNTPARTARNFAALNPSRCWAGTFFWCCAFLIGAASCLVRQVGFLLRQQSLALGGCNGQCDMNHAPILFFCPKEVIPNGSQFFGGRANA